MYQLNTYLSIHPLTAGTGSTSIHSERRECYGAHCAGSHFAFCLLIIKRNKICLLNDHFCFLSSKSFCLQSSGNRQAEEDKSSMKQGNQITEIQPMCSHDWKAKKEDDKHNPKFKPFKSINYILVLDWDQGLIEKKPFQFSPNPKINSF